MVMLGELYVDVHCYVTCYMVTSPLHVFGYDFHLRYQYLIIRSRYWCIYSWRSL